MKKKSFGIPAILLLFICVFAIMGYTIGIKGATSNNPTSTYNSITQLQNSVNYDFMVPNIISDDGILEMRNIMGSMVEIRTNNLLFRAAPFVAYNVEPSGDYTKYNIDNRYINEDGTLYVRYRTDGDKITIITIKMENIAYSIEYNYYTTEDEGLHNLGINIAEMKPITLEELQIDKTDTEEENADTDISFKQYNSKTGISFLIPEINGNVTEYNTEKSFNLVVNGSLVLMIQSLDSVNIEDIPEENRIELDNKYVLRYNLTPDSEDADYLLVVNNIDTIANTFKCS